MTWSSEDEPSSTADAHVEFDSAQGAERHRHPMWWWAVIAAGCLVAVGVVWQTGDGGAPSAVVTPTQVPTTSGNTSDGTSTTTTTTTPIASSPPIQIGDSDITRPDTRTSDDIAGSGSSIPRRPVVPASTTTTPRPSTTATTVAARTSTTIVVSADADSDAPDVRVVEGDIVEAVVAEPVANSSLDGADRSRPAQTPPASTAPPLACAGGGETQIDLLDVDRVTAEAADGSPRTVSNTDVGVGIAAGRDPVRVDYSAEHGASERLFVDLGGRFCSVVIELGDLAAVEWEGHAESAHWVGLGTDDRTVGEGWLRGGDDLAFTLQVLAPVERLLLEAAPYGATSAGWPVGADRVAEDNSDFVVVSITVR